MPHGCQTPPPNASVSAMQSQINWCPAQQLCFSWDFGGECICSSSKFDQAKILTASETLDSTNAYCDVVGALAHARYASDQCLSLILYEVPDRFRRDLCQSPFHECRCCTTTDAFRMAIFTIFATVEFLEATLTSL